MTKGRPPPGYGARLVELAARELGLGIDELAEAAGLSRQTVWRVKTDHEAASLSAATTLRRFLVGQGLKVLPPGDEFQPLQSANRNDPSEENIRKNLILVRESLGIDQFDAATASGVPCDKLRSYELGEHPVPLPALTALAKSYGTRPGEYLDADMPKVDPSLVRQINVGGPAARLLTAEERTKLEVIFAAVHARYASKMRGTGATPSKPKRRRAARTTR